MDDELFDELEVKKETGDSPWMTKDLFGKKKQKANFNFNRKKSKAKFEPVPRSDIYEPIRNNPYYIQLRNNGADKDDILCGANEEIIKINKVLYDCFTAADLKADERQMFQWVLANTTFYNRREVKLDVTRISKDINRSRSFVYKALHRLSDRKMVFITKAKRDEALTIYINTMPNTWNVGGDKIMKIMGAEESLNELDENV